MTSVTLHDVRFIEPEKTRNYLNIDYGAFSWLLTKDHKRIAILYLMSISVMFVLGGFFAMMMRLELLTPEGDKTRLRLTHQGLETFPKTPAFARKNFVEGWTQLIGSSLKEFVESGDAGQG